MAGSVPIYMTLYNKWDTKKMEWTKTSFSSVLKWTSPLGSMKSSEAQQETQREAILGHSPRMHWVVYVACLPWDEPTNFWHPKGQQWEAPILRFVCLRDQTFSDISEERGTLMYKAASWSRITVLMKGCLNSLIWEEDRKIDGKKKSTSIPLFGPSRHLCTNSSPPISRPLLK